MEEAVELGIPHLHNSDLRFIHDGKWVSVFCPRDRLAYIMFKNRYVNVNEPYTPSPQDIVEKLYPGFDKLPADDKRDYVWWKDKWIPYEKCSLELFIAKCRGINTPIN